MQTEIERFQKINDNNENGDGEGERTERMLKQKKETGQKAPCVFGNV